MEAGDWEGCHSAETERNRLYYIRRRKYSIVVLIHHSKTTNALGLYKAKKEENAPTKATTAVIPPIAEIASVISSTQNISVTDLPGDKKDWKEAKHQSKLLHQERRVNCASTPFAR